MLKARFSQSGALRCGKFLGTGGLPQGLPGHPSQSPLPSGEASLDRHLSPTCSCVRPAQDHIPTGNHGGKWGEQPLPRARQAAALRVLKEAVAPPWLSESSSDGSADCRIGGLCLTLPPSCALCQWARALPAAVPAGLPGPQRVTRGPAVQMACPQHVVMVTPGQEPQGLAAGKSLGFVCKALPRDSAQGRCPRGKLPGQTPGQSCPSPAQPRGTSGTEGHAGGQPC